MKNNILALILILVGTITSSSFASSPQPLNFIKNNVDGSQTLLGTTPSDTASSNFRYHAYSKEVLNLQIELPLRNQTQLNSLLQSIYDPQSPNYHQWLTPVQFAQQFGYTGLEINSIEVKQFLQSQGLSVTGQSPNGLVLYVSGSVPAVEHALGVHINHYQKSDGTSFFAPDADPTIPVQLAGKILAIGGMDNLPKFKPHVHQQLIKALPKAVGTAPGGYLAPNDVKTAYNLLNPMPSNDSGQTIALFELDGYKVSDITAYDSQFGIKLNTSLLTNILIDGFNGTPNYGSYGGAAEVTLDIELLTAFASGSNILVYEAPNSTQSWIDEWTRIATDNKAKVVSCSWGEPELDSPTLNFDNMIFAQMASQGQAVFVAAGDSGAYDAGGSTLAVDEPSSQPYVTAVGISKLSFGTGETYSSESASVYGGGGISKHWSIPSYQTTLASKAVKAAMVSTTMRNLPDVVLTADASTAYSFYINGSWGGYYGSSISAPIWASFISLVNQGLGANAPLGFANTWLYQLAQTSNYANDFYDITSGNNGYYPAEPGFDDATGLGSFNGLNLYNALVSSTKATSPPSAPTGLTATAGNAQVSLSWNASSGAVSYTVERATTSTGPYTTIASSVSNTTYTDSSVSNGTTYYYVVLAVNSDGSTASNQVSAKPVLPAPLTPTGLSAAAGNAQVSLSWNASGAATSYNVYRSNSGTGTFNLIATTANTSYTNTNLTNGTTYYYEVNASNTSGSSPNSAAVSATPSLPAVVATPTNLTGAATTYGRQPAILLQWTKSTSPNIIQYDVYRSTGTATPVLYGYVKGAQITGVYDLGVKHGTKYNYYVTAVNSSNVQSGPSKQISVNF